ncbi:MAG: hypothetical protein AAF889_12360 [Cyanobacteria bacterium P01_D01_bin.73]
MLSSGAELRNKSKSAWSLGLANRPEKKVIGKPSEKTSKDFCLKPRTLAVIAAHSGRSPVTKITLML